MIIFRFLFKLVVLLFLMSLKDGIITNKLNDLIAKSSIASSLLNFLIFWLATNIIIRLSQYIYRRRKKLGHKFSDNVIIGLKNIYYLMMFSAVIIMGLGLFGLQIKELLTAISIVAAAIAIISKELVLDVICGINFSFSRDIAIGDYVKIGDMEGKVLDLNIHKIVLLHQDNVMNIPNSKAYFSDIINYTSVHPNKKYFHISVPNYLRISKSDLVEMFNSILSRQHYIDLIDQSSIVFQSMSKDESTYKIVLLFKSHPGSISIAAIKSQLFEQLQQKGQSWNSQNI